MIQRFEEEYPECRVQTSMPQPERDDAPTSPERASLDENPISTYRKEAFGADEQDQLSPDGVRHASISRRSSDVSLASRQAQEEGQMHRFGQRMRREFLRPEMIDHAHGTTGEEEPEAEHLRQLRERLEQFPGEEIRQKMMELGPEGLFKAIGTTAEELKALEKKDPRIKEGRLMELYNASNGFPVS